MKISLNAIKKYVKIPENISTDELIKLIGSRLVEVEGSENLAPKYEGIYVAKVVECEPIEGTHLHLCKIEAGGDAVQVVCGAPNVHKGMLTAWITPGSIVPSTFGGEDFRLSVRKLRGYDSHGMLAAADELALGSDHEGIIEIDPKTAKPGDKFADVFDLNDIILDIENKSLTHRPDCFGLIGFAREVAGILGQKFVEPEVFLDAKSVNFAIKSAKNQPAIKISDNKICPRYSCAILDVASLPEKSKYFTKDTVFLAKAGMRSIDPVVDLTNILMLEIGQPLHAFDYDKFISVGGSKTPKILVRLARSGEELTLLDGKAIKCEPTDILITSNDVPVALAGAMGGANTEIDAGTKRIILESATFSLYNLRKTQMAHGIFSEAITRFTKGQPAGLTMPVLSEAVRRLGANPEAIADEYPSPDKPTAVKITTSDINSLLGTDYSERVIKETLENVGFTVKMVRGDAELSVTAPFWRTDIHIKEDLIEEVGRLLGYDNIALSFPLRPFIGAEKDAFFSEKSRLRTILSDRLAAHELLTYSFVSADLQSKVGEDPENSYKIVNSISPELQCFRQSLVPSLLDKIRDNLKSGHTDFTLYEINQISAKSLGLTSEKVPEMENHLAFVTLGDFYTAKALFKAIYSESLTLRPLKDSKYPYFEPLHSVEICLVSGKKEQVIGALGEIRASVLKKFKLDAPVSALELNLAPTLDLPKISAKSHEISKFPSVFRDLTIPAKNAQFSEISCALESALTEENLLFSVVPTSIYRPENDPETTNFSFHLAFSSRNHTLSSDEISDIMERITNKCLNRR